MKVNEIKETSAEMTNSRLPGEYGVVWEAVRLRCKITQDKNKCIHENTTPTKWNKATTILKHNKANILEL